MALSTYWLPSVEPPFIATNTAPGLMRRESYSMPVIASAASPDAPTEVISAINSFQCMSCSIVVGGEALNTSADGLARTPHHYPRSLVDHAARRWSLLT